MLKLVKVLGVLAALFTTVDRASALSFVATATTEDYVITNISTFPLTVSNLFLAGPTPGNLFPSSAFTTSAGASLAIGASFSQIVSGLIVGQTYTASYNLTGTGSPTQVAEHVSAVPLPAGFPLFAMALLALGTLGYFKARKNSAGNAGLSAA